MRPTDRDTLPRRRLGPLGRATTLAAAAILAATLLQAPASAAPPDHAPLAERVAAQQAEIAHQQATGALTPTEARFLQRQLRAIRIQAEIFARKGKTGPAAQALLEAHLADIAATLEAARQAANRRQGTIAGIP